MELKKITRRADRFEQWYTDVVINAKLMRYGPVGGTMIIRPNGWIIWESVQEGLNAQFKKLGVQNVSMPTLIPLSMFAKEKEHVSGFAPELFVVERVGDYRLPDPYAIRPTSEVLFATHFAEIVQSYKDLPLLYNQWCSVMRAEKTTRPFLRSSEFHWQEGHTVHANALQADQLSKKVLRVYERFVQKALCIPVIAGTKTPNERFAGAVNTYSLEAMMQDGKALQCATSHDLGQNFSKVYDIRFQNASNQTENAYQSSWGLSTRIIGAMIMIHGDDRGVVFPSACAPYQVAILTMFADRDSSVMQAALRLQKELAGKFRVLLDTSDKGLGYKLAEQEVIGTCLRIEIGPRDLATGSVVISDRLDNQKRNVALTEVRGLIGKELQRINKEMYARAAQRQRTVYVQTYEQFKDALKTGGFVAAPWGGDAAAEAELKRETTATARCIPFRPGQRIAKGAKCFFTGKPARRYVLFAIAY